MKKLLLSFSNLISTEKTKRNQHNATDGNKQLLPPFKHVDLLNLCNLFNLGGGDWIRHGIENVQRVNPCHYRLPLSVMPPFDYGSVTLHIMEDAITLDECVPNVVYFDTLNRMFLRDNHWHFNSLNLQLSLRFASTQRNDKTNQQSKGESKN